MNMQVGLSAGSYGYRVDSGRKHSHETGVHGQEYGPSAAG